MKHATSRPHAPRASARSFATAALAAAGTITIGLVAAPAFAGNATLTVESVGAAPGQIVRVPIRLSTEDLVGGFDFTVDASGLLTVDVDYNGLLFSNGWDGWDTAPQIGAHVSAACIFPEDQVTGIDIPLLDVLIQVPADAAPNSEIPVTLTDFTVSDYSFVPYDVTIVSGSIVIVSAGCDEDVDNDGLVGFNDLITVLGAWGPCETKCAADVDTDGSVGLNDLLRVLANWGQCS